MGFINLIKDLHTVYLQSVTSKLEDKKDFTDIIEKVSEKVYGKIKSFDVEIQNIQLSIVIKEKHILENKRICKKLIETKASMQRLLGSLKQLDIDVLTAESAINDKLSQFLLINNSLLEDIQDLKNKITNLQVIKNIIENLITEINFALDPSNGNMSAEEVYKVLKETGIIEDANKGETK